MKQRIKSNIKRVIPKVFIYESIRTLRNLKSLKAKRRFKLSSKIPYWLDSNMLKILQDKYDYPEKYGYDQQTLERRGRERAIELIKSLPNKNNYPTDFLELACGDGMVSCALQKFGKVTTGIDIQPNCFNERAAIEGVSFHRMNAGNLQFENETFDCVFSYAAFEHFAEAERVLKEAIRVVRKGGYIYLNFGPLYMSPFGLHAYRSLTVPYCQFFFPPEILENFTKKKGLKPPDFRSINCWSLEDYRELWIRHSNTLERMRYYEYRNVSHIDLIMRFPSCFKSKTNSFEDLIVSEIEILFKKIA